MPHWHVYVSPCRTDMYICHHASLTRICVTMPHWYVYMSPCLTDTNMNHDTSLTHICVTMPHWHVCVSRYFTDTYMCHHAPLTHICVTMPHCLNIKSGMALDLRTYVHPGRTCRFGYVVRCSGIPRKSRHGLTYSHFPVLIWLGNVIRSSRCMDKINIHGIFETIRIIQGQHGLPQSRFKTNESTVLTSQWCAFLHFMFNCKSLQQDKDFPGFENMLMCLSFSVERIHCLRFEIVCLLSRNWLKVKVSERWSRIDDARWTYGLVSAWNASFWKVYINLGSANMAYWLCE